MRIRVAFQKTEQMRYTSHLDLHRTWERTIRRAGLPLAYSLGFKPHPRINLACALPLGFTSQAELVDILLEQSLLLENVKSALQHAAPPGLLIERIEAIPLTEPALQAQILAAEYHLTMLDPIPDLTDRIDELLTAASLPRQRMQKNYDLRPLVISILHLPEDNEGHQCLVLRLSAREGATGRPEEVVLALGGAPTAARVHRTALLFNGQISEQS